MALKIGYFYKQNIKWS